MSVARLGRMRIGVTLPLAEDDTAEGARPRSRRLWPSRVLPRPAGSTRSGCSTTSSSAPGRAGPTGASARRGRRWPHWPRSSRASSSAHSSCAPRSATRHSWPRWPRPWTTCRADGSSWTRSRLARPGVRRFRLPVRPPGGSVRRGPRSHGALLRREPVASMGAVAHRERVRPPATGRAVPVLVAAEGRACSSSPHAGRTPGTRRGSGADDRLRAQLAGLDAACAQADATRRRSGGRSASGSTTRARATAIDHGPGCRCRWARPAFDDLAALGIDDAIVWSLSKSAAALDRIADARRAAPGSAG